jgi:RimJ/RimL family protein N-acetyltransferase
MIPILETDRLVLRPLELADAEQVQTLFPCWEVVQFLTEACDAVTDFWFGTLGFPVLRVSKAIANTASRRISLKQGMRVVEIVERDYVCGRLPAEVWELPANEWQRYRRRS